MSVQQLNILSNSTLAKEVLHSWKLSLITTMTAQSLLKQISRGELK